MRLSKILTTGPSSRAHQSGFTLVEILIALALITLLAVGISLSFDGSRSRAEALISSMSELGAANVRLKNDMGCYVNHPIGLVTAADAGSNNYCGISGTPTTWNGPYIGAFAGGTGGTVALNKVAQGVLIDFTSPTGLASGPYGTNGTNYAVTATAVPADIVTQALQECNGGPAATGFLNAKCDGDAATGSFSLMYDQTR
jgi:prepilin-type N-terminal cleavage/methylation domain-containing protein